MKASANLLQAGVMQSRVSKALVIPLLNRLKVRFDPPSCLEAASSFKPFSLVQELDVSHAHLETNLLAPVP